MTLELDRIRTTQIIIPNTVSQPWDPQEIITFTHECDWGSTETLSSTCPNGTDIITVCTGAALVRSGSVSTQKAEEPAVVRVSTVGPRS